MPGLAGVAVCALGCAGGDLDERDLGDTTSGTASDRTPLIGDDRRPDPFIAGEWLGRAENLFAPSGPNGERPAYIFPSGSSDFKLTIGLDDGTSPEGQIVFGSGPVPAPEQGKVYPPGFRGQIERPDFSLELELAPQEGRVYRLTEAVQRTSDATGVSAGVLALSYEANAAYSEWCPLQPPRARGGDYFDCLSASDPSDPNTCSLRNTDGSEITFDCDLGMLCNALNVCHCTSDGCESVQGDMNHLWFIRDGEELLGTFVGAVFDHGSPRRLLPVGTVRFQRVAP